MDKKVIKEYTGHVSNAVEKYQVTSEQQHEDLSVILAGSKTGEQSENFDIKSIVRPDPTLEVTVKGANIEEKPCMSCSCNKKIVKMNETDQISPFINGLIAARKGLKTTIRVEIEYS